MDLSNANIIHPPILDGSNYGIWKVKMRIYIKSIDQRAWRIVLSGWDTPRNIDDDGDNLPIPEDQWNDEQLQVSNYNSKALYAIFTTVDKNMFGLICNCISAKEAWDILQLHCEGSASVKRTKLRMLESRFENLRMEENETIPIFDAKIRDISYEAQSLGDPLSNERLVNKVLRSLPEKFNIKICAIEEACDTSTLSLDELMNSLRRFEMNLELQKQDKGKTVAFEVSQEVCQELFKLTQEVGSLDFRKESIAMCTKKFRNYLTELSERRHCDKSKASTIHDPEKSRRLTRFPIKDRHFNAPKSEPKSSSDSIKCQACSGYGHYANECANTLKKKGMSINVVLSEDEDDEVNHN